ncbi:host-nuclease inhibitor Gam family protein [Lactobacillus sp. CC-MHH1034]|uniref:host-nuclease inhibitor Gam family protein n=1 Tax=Agrilactobacillus fermenti TaxID=2586909 RepID=UPI001E4A1409|nr:host-nuclease inhibitor Gam family protein [Agrilactobacillus fermenti]MCD2257112.1 host-nuclease inhibitor Gam family protein [Agrilactobacillus fermenti]
MDAMKQSEINEIQKDKKLQSDVDKFNEGEKTPWSITNIHQADWALRKIEALQAQMKEDKALSDSEHLRIEQWYQDQTKGNQDSINYFQAQLFHYLQDLRQDDPKARIKTPHGSVGTRKGSTKLVVTDEQKLLEQIKHTELAAKVIKQTINRSELKKVTQNADGKVVNEDGEPLEGVEYQTGEESLNITWPRIKGDK